MRRLFDEIKANDPERYEKIIQTPFYKEAFNQNILIVKTNTVISIYDKNNSFESIQNKVKNLSLYIDYPILYTSNFDDGVFLMGAYKSGKLITSGKMGLELSVYGMKRKQIIGLIICH